MISYPLATNKGHRVGCEQINTCSSSLEQGKDGIGSFAPPQLQSSIHPRNTIELFAVKMPICLSKLLAVVNPALVGS